MTIISHIPTWVFIVLAVLLALGVLQSRPRPVRPGVIAPVALALAAYSLWGVVATFGAGALAVLPWLAGLAAALWVGPRLLPVAGLQRLPGSGRVLVPGSWLPLVLMMGIFGIRFGLGMAAGLGARVPAGSTAAMACALALGLLSGLFGMRALAILRAARA